MAHRRFAGFVLLLIAVLIWALPAGAYWENEVTIKGTVFAVDNDDKGKTTEVSVLDAAGEEYFVVHDAVGDKLLDLVDKNVTVKGVINVDKDNKKRIRVISFELFPT
ncbi:MAG: hypothetical protein ACYDAA_11295 [Syntrophales bacterium]